MIDLAPYDDHQAMAVLSRLDQQDLLEATIARGGAVTHLQMFADWRAMQPHTVLSLVLLTHARGEPFAVVLLGRTGQAGVAQAGLLARSHARFRRSLAEVGVLIRQRMPKYCADVGLRRIEARCWSDHPTAGAFLTKCGFHLEARLPGFGPSGHDTFCQFAWTQPHETEA